MKPKKSRLLIILIIFILILIVSAGIAYMYFLTDLMKSNRQNFSYYALQIVDENGFFEKNLADYFQNLLEKSFENNGNITCKVAENNNINGYSINDFSIEFSGQMNLSEQNLSENIKINYSPEVNFPLTIRKDNDQIGLQTEYVGSKFIVNKLQNIQNGEQITKISEKLSQNGLTREEISIVLNKYIKIIDEKLSDEKFTKSNENEYNVYTLNLTMQDMKNIYTVVFETLKTDTQLLEKIGNLIGSDITVNDINNLLEELNSLEINEDEVLKIALYSKNRKLEKINFRTEEIDFTIEKNKISSELKYTLTIIPLEYGLEHGKILINATYKGLDTLQNINENYEIVLDIYSNNEEQISRTYNFKNNVKFIDSLNIEDFTEENSIDLSNYNETQVNTLLASIIERIIQVNKDQMEKLGLEENENPILDFVLFNEIIENMDNADLQNLSNNTSELEVTTFNSKFELYESSNSMGTTTRGLLTTISSNNIENADNDWKIKEIHFDGSEYEATEQNILLVKSSIEPNSYYKIEFERDSNTGMIYRVVITKK